jgi:hypothetical protein
MKISELIQSLEDLKAKNGDIEVYTYDWSSANVKHYSGPKVRSIRAKKPRERLVYLASISSEETDNKVLVV